MDVDGLKSATLVLAALQATARSANAAIVVLRAALTYFLQLEIDKVEACRPTRRVGLAPSL